MQLDEAMTRTNALFAHAWMVRNFLKHAEEAEDDEELLGVHRTLFDVIRALEGDYQRRDAKEYFRRAQGKLHKLREGGRDHGRAAGASPRTRTSRWPPCR